MLHIFFKGWQNHPAESSEESVMGLIESGSSEWAACFNYTAFALFRFGEATSHNIAANCVPRLEPDTFHIWQGTPSKKVVLLGIFHECRTVALSRQSHSRPATPRKSTCPKVLRKFVSLTPGFPESKLEHRFLQPCTHS